MRLGMPSGFLFPRGFAESWKRAELVCLWREVWWIKKTVISNLFFCEPQLYDCSGCLTSCFFFQLAAISLFLTCP